MTPAEVRQYLATLTREEKLALFVDGIGKERDRRRQEAAAPPIAADGSRLIRVPGLDGRSLVFRYSADDLAL